MQAVNSAVDYIETATGVDISTLTEMGVVEQLLAYHVAPGAALAMDRLVGGQELTMLDGNMTTISTCVTDSYAFANWTCTSIICSAMHLLYSHNHTCSLYRYH